MDTAGDDSHWHLAIRHRRHFDFSYVSDGVLRMQCGFDELLVRLIFQKSGNKPTTNWIEIGERKLSSEHMIGVG